MEKVKQVKLGRTNIVCGELGMGCEGFSKVTEKEARDMIDLALSKGMNFIDLYASNPTVRENIGKAINGRREEIYIQGHLCTIWKDNQYKRTRDILRHGDAPPSEERPRVLWRERPFRSPII